MARLYGGDGGFGGAEEEGGARTDPGATCSPARREPVEVRGHDRALNPKKAVDAPRAPYSYAYPYQMPPPYYAMRMPSPTYAPAPAVAAPAPSVQRPAASMRFCIQCGKQIPVEAKFCPYCRHAYTN